MTTLPLLLLLGTPLAHGSARANAPPHLLDTVARRAFAFFWNESDGRTGLTKDRASNLKKSDHYTVASIASTGYALAAYAIGAQRGWVSRPTAYRRALVTLRFIHDHLPAVHGFYYHFVDMRTGARVWKCELSSIDSALLILGALAAGQYWRHTEVQRLANELYHRMDFRWMQGSGDDPSRFLTMGWKPESGFLESRWSGYSEASYLYLLALGSPTHPLPSGCWDRWTFPETTIEGHRVFGGPTPLFMAQMTSGYFDLRGKMDRQGRDWWKNFKNAHIANHDYCARNPQHRRTYSPDIWGITASDAPHGYSAQEPADGQNDGTVAPTAALGSVVYEPKLARRSLNALWENYHHEIWGRYGFSNAFNVDANWYDPDVVGIDLGMMLLAVENHRTGLIWRLTGSRSSTLRGMRGAGFVERVRRHDRGGGKRKISS